MRLAGFGQQGQAQSQQYAFQACIICGAPIRVSFFLLAFFGFQLWSSQRMGFNPWSLLFLCGQEAILILTVLCHEFGHGNAARYVGGEIDHILLWPFGGICFSSRPEGATDRRTVLKNDLGVVAAGPATHFLMTPAWALLLLGMGAALQAQCNPNNCFGCEGIDCVWAFLKPLGETPGFMRGPEGGPLVGDLAATVWELLGVGIRLNVTLFLFNVFFPMYPADGAKLMTVGLMHCFGTSEVFAATALIWSSTCSAGLLILYAMYSYKQAITTGNGMGTMMPGLMGMMGVMSLVEAYRIYGLREEQRLYTHPLFRTARSWNDRRDGFDRINTWDMDDPVERQGAEPLCCMCPCWLRGDGSSSAEETELPRRPAPPRAQAAPLGGAPAEGAQRARREGLLERVEGQQAQRAKTVKQLEEERLGTRGASSR